MRRESGGGWQRERAGGERGAGDGEEGANFAAAGGGGPSARWWGAWPLPPPPRRPRTGRGRSGRPATRPIGEARRHFMLQRQSVCGPTPLQAGAATKEEPPWRMRRGGRPHRPQTPPRFFFVTRAPSAVLTLLSPTPHPTQVRDHDRPPARHERGGAVSWRGMGAELGRGEKRGRAKHHPRAPAPFRRRLAFFFFPAPAPHPIPRRAPPAFPLALTPSPSFLFPPLLPPPPPSDLELAKFEAFLKKEGGAGVSALVRGRQRLAYPIKGYWEGVYVLLTVSRPSGRPPRACRSCCPRRPSGRRPTCCAT